MFAAGSPNPLLLMPQNSDYHPPKNKLDLYNELQLILGYEKFRKVLSAIELLERESLLRNPFAELTSLFQKREEQNLIDTPIMHKSSSKVSSSTTPEKAIEQPKPKPSTAAKSQKSISNPTTAQTWSSQNTATRAKEEFASLLHKYPKYFRSQSLKSLNLRKQFEKQRLQIKVTPNLANTWARKSLEVRLGLDKDRLQPEEEHGFIKSVTLFIERVRAKFREIKCRMEVFKYNYILRT